MDKPRDNTRRSESRQAAVLVRMSHAEREALHKVAQERGTNLTDLLLHGVADLLPRELQDA